MSQWMEKMDSNNWKQYWEYIGVLSLQLKRAKTKQKNRSLIILWKNNLLITDIVPIVDHVANFR